MVDSLILCTSPRSGSTLLCGLLAQTGLAGKPASYFHRPSLAAWLEAHGLAGRAFASDHDALRATVDRAKTKGRAGTDVFALRLQSHSLPFFAQQLAVLHPNRPSDRTRIEAEFGRTLFVYLHRADKLAQAISYVKADQSGLWHRASDGSELERVSPPQEPAYDRNAIADRVRQAKGDDAAWNAWFTSQAITPLQVGYDDLSSHPQVVVADILTALGQEPTQALNITPHVAPLRDVLSAQWYARFVREQALE